LRQQVRPYAYDRVLFRQMIIKAATFRLLAKL
jgi:hypothetical protein